MPSRSKKQAKQIVVRTIKPGARKATKSVFGTLTELNEHKPLEELDLSADWTIEYPPKPWKKYKPLPVSSKPQTSRRNPGRDDEETWVTPRFVCGRAIGPAWDGGESDDVWRSDVEREWAREDASAGEVRSQDQGQARREVNIMDIAKPMKPKGVSKQFEVVETVRRVIALEDDSLSEWASQIGSDLELDEWDMLDEDARRVEGSYAELVQLRPD